MEHKTNKVELTAERFWHKARDIFHLYYDRSRYAILTDKERLSEISEFLTDMDLLASEWYNRDVDKR